MDEMGVNIHTVEWLRRTEFSHCSMDAHPSMIILSRLRMDWKSENSSFEMQTGHKIILDLAQCRLLVLVRMNPMEQVNTLQVSMLDVWNLSKSCVWEVVPFEHILFHLLLKCLNGPVMSLFDLPIFLVDYVCFFPTNNLPLYPRNNVQLFFPLAFFRCSMYGTSTYIYFFRNMQRCLGANSYVRIP